MTPKRQPSGEENNEATAESLASLAALGRVFRGYVFLHDDPGRIYRDMKGAISAEQRFPSSHDPWREGVPLRITMDAASQGGAEEERARAFILKLAESQPDAIVADVAGHPSERKPDPPIGSLSWEHAVDGSGFVARTTRKPSALHFFPSRSPNWPELGQSLFPNAPRNHVHYLLPLLHAHATLHNDLLVTSNPSAIEWRFRNQWTDSLGLTTPSEALSLVHLYLRGTMEKFPISGDAHIHGDALQYFATLTKAHLPTTIKALRSSLAPRSRGSHRGAVDFIESILLRYQNLLVAADQLAWMNQQEGIRRGNNGLLSQQLYHLQTSLILTAACLDALAWVIVELAGRTPPREHVSWRKMLRRRPPKWVEALEGQAMRMVERARRHSDNEFLSLAYSLRDSVQHRYPLRGGVAEFHDGGGDTGVAISVVDPREDLSPESDVLVPGAFYFDESPFLMPYQFQRSLRQSLVRHIESVMSEGSWVDDDWWRETTIGKQYEEMVAQTEPDVSWIHGEL